MNIRSSHMTACESLRNAMDALLPAIGDAAHARDHVTLHTLTRLQLRMDTTLRRLELAISREVDKAEFVAEG